MATKRGKGEDLLQIIPYDLVMEILSWLPVKSILRFKCVSKSWLAMLTNPHFVKLHLTRSSNSKLVLTCSLNSMYSLEPPIPMRNLFVSSWTDIVEAAASDDDVKVEGIEIVNPCNYEQKAFVRIAGSCRGLVLCYKPGHRGTLYLVNPSTREVKRLPDLPLISENYAFAISRGLGYDASHDDYKVVQILSPYYSTEFITCVYSLKSKSNSWRRISDSPLSIQEDSCGLFLNGKLHWFNQDMSKMGFLSLDEEKFGYVPLPDIILTPQLFTPGLIGIVKGCLYLVSEASCCGLTFWVMKEYGMRETWTKFEFGISCDTMKPLDFPNDDGDVDLFAIGRTELVMCNLREKTHRRVEFYSVPLFWDQWDEAVTCLETIVSPKSYNLL
ncbi:F-box/kelch-repeat protein At3g06240-like [Cornus florida]|uniref:F-box/kelch-repeat protein At3g06240-like n=1 Tax=Cornus florida TaxID=4283 RepID=UPI00289D7849|nr:F-box/kelch-repeat protein At3g06240-like [Cornus florida]XP_059635813.1 F-box/kelch-repeat protein At3g06240-like [Cornus florida]XP_059635814.1 F-box/kelch-repeat protein At3g06240-like [Cornus florida]XP_059635818.1 F-box/kelch-repeat protein At3g06240-like [Cornus florida]